MPEDRLSNEYARSNWLDNANFGHRNLSRKQSIAAIQRSSSMRELILLMNPNHDKMFGWNFLYLLNSPNGTIEFWRGAACTSAQQAFVYIRLLCHLSKRQSSWAARKILKRHPALWVVSNSSSAPHASRTIFLDYTTQDIYPCFSATRQMAHSVNQSRWESSQPISLIS